MNIPNIEIKITKLTEKENIEDNKQFLKKTMPEIQENIIEQFIIYNKYYLDEIKCNKTNKSNKTKKECTIENTEKKIFLLYLATQTFLTMKNEEIKNAIFESLIDNKLFDLFKNKFLLLDQLKGSKKFIKQIGGVGFFLGAMAICAVTALLLQPVQADSRFHINAILQGNTHAQAQQQRLISEFTQARPDIPLPEPDIPLPEPDIPLPEPVITEQERAEIMARDLTFRALFNKLGTCTFLAFVAIGVSNIFQRTAEYIEDPNSNTGDFMSHQISKKGPALIVTPDFGNTHNQYTFYNGETPKPNSLLEGILTRPHEDVDGPLPYLPNDDPGSLNAYRTVEPGTYVMEGFNLNFHNEYKYERYYLVVKKYGLIIPFENPKQPFSLINVENFNVEQLFFKKIFEAYVVQMGEMQPDEFLMFNALITAEGFGFDGITKKKAGHSLNCVLRAPLIVGGDYRFGILDQNFMVPGLSPDGIPIAPEGGKVSADERLPLLIHDDFLSEDEVRNGARPLYNIVESSVNLLTAWGLRYLDSVNSATLLYNPTPNINTRQESLPFYTLSRSNMETLVSMHANLYDIVGTERPAYLTPIDDERIDRAAVARQTAADAEQAAQANAAQAAAAAAADAAQAERAAYIVERAEATARILQRDAEHQRVLDRQRSDAEIAAAERTIADLQLEARQRREYGLRMDQENYRKYPFTRPPWKIALDDSQEIHHDDAWGGGRRKTKKISKRIKNKSQIKRPIKRNKRQQKIKTNKTKQLKTKHTKNNKTIKQ